MVPYGRQHGNVGEIFPEVINLELVDDTQHYIGDKVGIIKPVF